MIRYNTVIVLLGTSALGAVAGALGSYLVLRRRALLGDALAHAALPGLAIAFLLIGARNFSVLLFGAFIAALVGAWAAAAIPRHTRIKDDAAIGIVLSVFFGFGIVMSRIVQNTSTTASKAGLDSFIFGKTAGMIAQDVYIIIGVAALVLALLVLLHKEFKLLSFDPEFAAVQGWPVHRLDILMMGLVCVTTIIGLPAVGLALMAALLIIPGAAARFWTDSLAVMLSLAGFFGLVTGLTGTAASAYFPGIPTGPVIILAGTAIFIVSMLVSPRRGAFARLYRHLKLRRRIANQNLLRTLYEVSEPAWPDPTVIIPADLMKLRAWSPRQTQRLLETAADRGWIEPVAGGYTLTAEGWQRAAKVVKVHRLWEIFLIEEAQVAPSYVDRDAEEIEHVLPPDIVDRLERRLVELGLLPMPLMEVPERHQTLVPLESGSGAGGA